ncbi:MAG: AMP-binding protein, partial [Myxococcota bacterium]
MRSGTWLDQRAASSPTKPALEVGGRVLSYGELLDLSRRTADRLSSLDVGEGDVIAVLLENGLGIVTLLHAADLCGAILLPLNLRLSAPELRFQLRDSGAKLLIYAGVNRAECARDAIRGLSGVRSIDFDSQLEPTRGARAGKEASPTSRFDLVDARMAQAILYTSGTTGAPKGATLTRGNFFWSAAASAALLGVQRSDRWLVCMPLSHVGGLSILLRSVLYGIPTVVHENFDAAAVNEAIDERGVTHVSLVPTMLLRVLEMRGDRPAPTHLRCVLIGGGTAPDTLLESARELDFPVAPSYGLTEATSQVATCPPTSRPARGTSALRPLPGTELRIAKSDGSAA